MKQQVKYLGMKYLIILFAILFVGAFFIKKIDPNDGFKTQNIARKLDFRDDFAFYYNQDALVEAKSIFKKPLHYMCKGGQVYIFESADHKWVVKFMKYQLLTPSFKNKCMAKVPFLGESIPSLIARRQGKFDNLFFGNLKAARYYPENAALLMLHFNPTVNLFGHAELVDKLGHSHKINLDETAFIIQKKGMSLSKVVGPLIKEGNFEAARARLEDIIGLYKKLYQAGLYDRDYGVMSNFGFYEDKPLHIDLGKLTEDLKIKDAANAESDLKKVKARMRLWLKKHFPENVDKVLP